MLEQIKQVGMTYVTQRYLWLLAALLSIMVLPNLILSASSTRSPARAEPQFTFVVGMPMLILLPFLVGLAKMQLAHSRARLTPRFFPAHLAVLGGILLTIFMLYPFTLACAWGAEPLALLALAVAIGAFTLWGAQLNRLSAMIISLAVFYSLLTDWGLRWWIIEAADHREIHGIIAAVGIALIMAWLWRLCHLDEEMDDYQNVYQLAMARRTGSDAIEQRRAVATQASRNWLGVWIGDWWYRQLGGYYGGSNSSRARVLRYGFGTLPIEAHSLLIMVFAVCVGIFLSQFSFLEKEGASMGLYFLFGQFAILLPGQMAGEMLARRRPRIAYELLLPLSRADLIDGLFAASIRNSSVLWLTINISLGVVVAAANTELLPRTVAMYLLISAATTIATMAISLRVSVWPSKAKRFTVLFPSWFVLLAPLVVWGTMHEKVGNAPFYFVVVLLLSVGTWLLYAARNAWLKLELA